MKKRFTKGFIAAFLLLNLTGCSSTNTSIQNEADAIFTNGIIYTMGEDEKAESVAVKDGKILAVGNNTITEEYKGNNTEIVDLNSQTMVPGFIDSHTHAANTVEVLFGADLSVGENFDDYINIMSEYYKENKSEEAIYGAGWINPYIMDIKNPKETLDKITTEKPLILIAEDRHTLWLNSKALEIANVTKDTKDPEGGTIGRLENGEPNGILYESAMGDALSKLPSFSKEQIQEGIKEYDKMALERGVTQITHVLMYQQPEITKAILDLEKKGELNVDHYLSYTIFPNEGVDKIPQILEMKESLKGNKVKFNSAKVFDDGVLEGETAYLLDDYTNKPGYRGYSVWNKDKYFETIKELDKLGIQIHAHVIGDAAIKNTLDAMEIAKKENNSSGLRHKLTHVQLIRDEDIDRMKELDIMAVLQPVWAYKEDGFYDQAVELVGRERADSQYPLNSLIEKGIVVSSSSDFPVTVEWSPLEGMEVGVTRNAIGALDKDYILNGKEATSIDNMLKSYTINGAYSNFSEDITGSIEEGKEADLVILDKDIFSIEPNEIAKTKVLSTYADGKKAYSSR